MNNNELTFAKDFTEKGFVFSPFNNDENSILFPIEKAQVLKELVEVSPKKSLNDFVYNVEHQKEFHIQLVNKTVSAIKNTQLKKVVVSRKEEVKIADLNSIEIYKSLLSNYTKAFVYIWYHPKVGLWLGATPETLLETNNSHFKTMSLAGTQKYQEDTQVSWGLKEKEEQQLVTDFIENQVTDLATNIKIETAKTVKAGALLHLQSRVEGKLLEHKSLKDLIRALHPTPAVCGLPREEAKQFILKNENYNRSFYTGFLGELNFDENSKKTSHLFVNLRCMEIKNTKAFIYVGGGITKDSNATKEWKETVAKTTTMKTVL